MRINGFGWGISAIFGLVVLPAGCSSSLNSQDEGVGRVSNAVVTPADFTNLRARWANFLTGGAGLPSDPDYQNRLAAIAAHANDLWHGSALYPAMDTSAGRTFLWSDLQFTPSGSVQPLQTTYERIRDLTLALKTPGSLHDNATLRATILSALDWLTANWYGPAHNKSGGWYAWSIGVPLALADTVIMLDLPATAIPPEKSRYDYIAPIDCYIGNPQDDANGQPVGAPCLASPAGDHTYQHPNGDANHAWETLIYAEWGALTDSSVLITLAKNGTDPLLLSETSSGDGFYADGSYIGHTNFATGQAFAYTEGYGEGYFASVENILYLLQGSPWAVTDTQQILKKWALNSFAPFVFQGTALQTTTGREMSKQADSDRDLGSRIASEFLLAGELFPSSRASLRNQAKAWISGGGASVYYSDPYTSPFLIQLAKQSADSPTPATASYSQFPRMDRAVAQRPSFAFGMNMMSNRIYGPEIAFTPSPVTQDVNQDNLRGWFQGFGQTFLYTTGEHDQYSDKFWPTVDPYYLPGITVEHVAHSATSPGVTGAVPPPLAVFTRDHSGNLNLNQIVNQSNWAGGATNGVYGASGMALFPNWVGSAPGALKSWFVFDNEVFCLGSDVATTGSSYMETVVDNRRLNSTGSNVLTVNGVVKPSSIPWSETMTQVRSVHLQGTGNAGIGYYFPQSQQIVRGARESRTDCWKSVSFDNLPCPNSTVSANYLKLVLQHNDAPADGTYAYVLLPSVTASQTTAYANSPDVFVLRQDSGAHAVKDNALNVVMANFWNSTKAGQQDAAFNVGAGHPNWLACNAKASIVVAETSDANGDYEELTVADPTQGNSNPIKITMEMFATSVVSSNPRVTVPLNTRPTVITVDPTGSKGASIKVKFKMHY